MRKIKIGFLCSVLLLGILNNNSVCMAKEQGNIGQYCIDDYQKVISEYNKEYGTDLQIQDKNLFYENVYNQVTPSDLYDSLRQAPRYEKNVSDVKKGIVRSYPSETITYKNTVYTSRGSIVFFADIYTQFAGEKGSFVKFSGAGTLYDKNANYFVFRGMSYDVVSFSSKSCTVRFKGTWVIPRTGISDLSYETYNITFQPR